MDKEEYQRDVVDFFFNDQGSANTDSYLLKRMLEECETLLKFLKPYKKHIGYEVPMDIENYDKNAFAKIEMDIDVLHCILGKMEESIEIFQEYLVHGAHTVEFQAELGDDLFYTTKLKALLGVDDESLMKQNATKLITRYGHKKYSKEKAINRDYDAEFDAIKGKEND